MERFNAMVQRLLVIVPCGKSKVWNRSPDQGPTSARDVYTSGLFKVNRTFAEHYSDRWVILSAKYGFIPPSFVIPGPYEVTFKDLKTNPISLQALRQQVQEQGLYQFDRIISLGGAAYRHVVQAAFVGFEVKLEFPTTGLTLGRTMQFVKSYNPREDQ